VWDQIPPFDALKPRRFNEPGGVSLTPPASFTNNPSYGTWAADHKTLSVMGLTPAREAAAE